MSFGHNVSRKSGRNVYYRVGVKQTPNRWYSRRIGWFGNSMVMALFVVSGVTALEFQQTVLQSAGAQLHSVVEANKAEQKAVVSYGNTPAVATNIIDLQPLVTGWAKENKAIDMGIAVMGSGGPQIEASHQAEKQFQTKAMYKLYLAAAIYAQKTDKKLFETVQVGKQKVTYQACLERVFKDDDAACLMALSGALDLPATKQFFGTNGMTKTSLDVLQQRAQTTANDTVAFFRAVDNALLPEKVKKRYLALVGSQPTRQSLTVACPGCTTVGTTDFGVGRLEAAGIVRYANGNYVYVVYGAGGTKDMTVALSGKLQQRIVEVTTGNIKP